MKNIDDLLRESGVPEEKLPQKKQEIKEKVEAEGYTLEDVEKAWAYFITVFAVVEKTVKDLWEKLSGYLIKITEELYAEAGKPYGDSEEGQFKWLRENSDKFFEDSAKMRGG